MPVQIWTEIFYYHRNPQRELCALLFFVCFVWFCLVWFCFYFVFHSAIPNSVIVYRFFCSVVCRFDRWSCLLSCFNLFFSLLLLLFECVVGKINYHISFVICLIRFADEPQVKFQKQGQCTLMPINTERMPLEFFNYPF